MAERRNGAKPTPRELETLRKQIRAADEAILANIARRLEAAQRIGAVKRRHGLPLRNYDVEAQVIRDARALCKRFHIDQELGEEVMRTLIRAAVQAQEKRLEGRP
jgi:chorismate mutase/prephenate dehydrogenase